MAVVLLLADLVWLGWLGAGFYEPLEPLRAPSTNLTAAGLFYVLYLCGIWYFAVRDASSPREAAVRGALLGVLAYGTFELTAWAVLTDWPAEIVVVDMLWGAALTAGVAACGAAVWAQRP